MRSEVLTEPIHIEIQQFLDSFNMGIKIIEFKVSTKTSELAAEALGVEVGQIAKSMLLLADESPVLFVTCGDVKINTNRIRKLIGVRKVKFADAESVLNVTGYPVGGVCPFRLNSNVRVMLDKVMEKYEVVYAAAGTACSAVPVTIQQLKQITGGEIVDIA